MLDGPPLRMLKTGENDNIEGKEVTGGKQTGTDQTLGESSQLWFLPFLMSLWVTTVA